MARWRLTNKHYLNIQALDGGPVEWEYVETSRDSGRRARKLFKVPLYLNPEDPADHNHPGMIIVAHEGPGVHPKDYIFSGDPTPDMEPIDEEAELLSEKVMAKSQHPIESLSGNYGEALAANFQSQVDALMKGIQSAITPVVSAGQVSKADFDALKAQVDRLIAENTALRAASTQPQPARRA